MTTAAFDPINPDEDANADNVQQIIDAWEGTDPVPLNVIVNDASATAGKFTNSGGGYALDVVGPFRVTGTISNAGGPVFNVEAYGGDKTGATAIDSVWSTIMAALPSTGGRIYFPAGSYECTGALSVTKPCMIYGDGMLTSIISSRSATADVFSVSVPTNKVVHFQSLGIAKTAAGIPSTDGAGIKMVCSDSGQSLVVPIVERCFIGNQFIGLELWDATHAHITGNSFGEQRDCAVQFDATISPQGFGDHFILGNSFTNGYIAANVCGVRILRGAGFMIANNKFIGFQTQVLLDTQTGALNQSDLYVLGNSMEGQGTATLACVALSGDSAFEDILISDNQMVVGAGGAITLDSASLGDVLATGNTIDVSGTGTYAIGGSAGDDMYAAGNKIQVGAACFGFVNTGITNFRRGLNEVSGAGSLQSGTFAYIQPRMQTKRLAMTATNAALGNLFKGPASSATAWPEPFMVTPHTILYAGVTEGALQAVIDTADETEFTAHAVGAATGTAYTFDITALADG